MTKLQREYFTKYFSEFTSEVFGGFGRTMDDLIDFVIKREVDQLIELRIYISKLNERDQLELDGQSTKAAKLTADIEERGLV